MDLSIQIPCSSSFISNFSTKTISLNVLYEDINIIRATVISEDGTSYATYRSSLVVNYLFEFLYLVSNGLSTQKSANNLEDGDYLSNDAKKPSLLSSGKQLVKINREYYPVVNQSLNLVLLFKILAADTQKLADRAASLSIVDYNTDNLEPPILTLEEAVEKSSFFEVTPFLYPAQIGDFSKGMAEVDHKINSEIKLGSQYYFYMETQTALVILDEDNCMVVYVHIVIARCLGIPEHSVRVITRRVGGGFDGKAIKTMPRSSFERNELWKKP